MRGQDPEHQPHPGEWNEDEYLGHDPIFINGVNASLFNRLSEGDQFLISIELAPMLKTPSPSKDSDRQSPMHNGGPTKQWDW